MAREPEAERAVELIDFMREPGLRGVVFDLPHVAAEAVEFVRAAGLADRVEVVGGDFFESSPLGKTSTCWRASCTTGMTIKRRASSNGVGKRCGRRPGSCCSKAVVRPGTEPDLAKLIDLHMLVLFGARERTRDEWEHLRDRAGFALERIIPTPGLAWIEARSPAGRKATPR